MNQVLSILTWPLGASAHFKRFTLILQSLSKMLSSSASAAVVVVVVVLSNLYSLDLVGHHHGVLLTDLGGSLGLVIVGTVVLVGVPVDAAEQVAAATVKA